MFKLIISGIFPSFNDQTTPDYEFFERSRGQHQEQEEQTSRQLAKQISDQPKEDNASPLFSRQFDNDFYSYLFGESTIKVKNDPLSEYVSKHISELLLAPADLLNEMPVMPESVNAALALLNKENFNINDVLSIISKEPSMAADTIKLANSAKYQRNNKEVIDIKTAFMNIGSQGIIDGVLYIFINKFTPSSALYFKCFGCKIWQHCQQTATLSQSLAELALSEEDRTAAYLIGLIRNLGIMITFQLMIDAFGHIAPDATPNSMAFKKLMSNQSLTLTIAMAKHWQLPQIIILAIEQQHLAQSMKSPLASCISDANFISKVLSLFNDNIIDETEYKKYCHLYLPSEASKNIAFEHLS